MIQISSIQTEEMDLLSNSPSIYESHCITYEITVGMNNTTTEYTKLHTLNEDIRKTLIDEGIMNERDSSCGEWKNKREAKERNYQDYRFKSRCGNIHSCPVCRHRHIDRIQKKHFRMNSEYESVGGRILVLTFTVPPFYSDSLFIG